MKKLFLLICSLGSLLLGAAARYYRAVIVP